MIQHVLRPASATRGRLVLPTDHSTTIEAIVAQYITYVGDVLIVEAVVGGSRRAESGASPR
jgi:hypothetical protein